MKLFNLEIKKHDPNSVTLSDKQFLNYFDKHQQDILKGGASAINMRTEVDPFGTYGSVGGGGASEIRIPYYPLVPGTLYSFAYFSDILKTVILALNREIFRPGIEIKERFTKKCEDCGTEFDNPIEECKECESTNLRDPDREQKRVLELFMKRMNDNNQSLKAVSREYNNDLEVIDDAYLLATKDYYFNGKGEILDKLTEVKEFVKVSPTMIYIIADNTGRLGRDSSGKEVYFCLEHRSVSVQDKTICQCGKHLKLACYRGQGLDGTYIYYSQDEIYHISKYTPSLVYGFSNIYAIWQKVSTLMAQDTFMNKYYTKARPPTGILAVKTRNMASLEKAWAFMLDMFKKNPHQTPPLAIETESNGDPVKLINFMNTLQEMQFTETRNELRTTIGSLYGVQPIFQGDQSTSGGLNNEGLQITVTNRAMELGQEIYNDGAYPWIAKQLNVTDYMYEINPPEEKDEMAELQLDGKKMENAQRMQGMGFDVIYNEDGDFEYDPLEEAVEPPLSPETDMFGQPKGPSPAESGLTQETAGAPQKPSQE